MHPNENELIFADRIYCDTSTLMNIPRMKMFISNYRETMHNSKSTIIIPAPVTQELVRHLSDGEKREMARQALDLIRVNNDIFRMDEARFSYEDIRTAFADPALYKILLSQRNNCRQLLITNDRKLSCDVFHLNDIESWSGRTVAVCYIGQDGMLCPCECVAEAYSSNTEQAGFSDANSAEKKEEKQTDYPHTETPADTSGDWWLYLLGGFTGGALFLAGFFTGRSRFH